MADSVSRWTKHGKDRAYVRAGGSTVGFVDLTSGTVHVYDRTNADRVWRAVAGWATSNRVKLPMRGSAMIMSGSGERVEGDLSGQQAGTAAQAASTAKPSLLSRVFGGKPSQDSWAKGAAGERETGKVLKSLEPQWQTVHSVPIGVKGSDIDHVTMGPGGIYTLNTKNHGNRTVTVSAASFLLDGKKTDYIDAAVFEAERASELVSNALGHHIVVRPLIVPIAKTVTVTAAPRGVFVVPLPQLGTWLKNRPPTFNDRQVQRLYEVASNAKTWNAAR